MYSLIKGFWSLWDNAPPKPYGNSSGPHGLGFEGLGFKGSPTRVPVRAPIRDL